MPSTNFPYVATSLLSYERSRGFRLALCKFPIYICLRPTSEQGHIHTPDSLYCFLFPFTIRLSTSILQFWRRVLVPLQRRMAYLTVNHHKNTKSKVYATGTLLHFGSPRGTSQCFRAVTTPNLESALNQHCVVRLSPCLSFEVANTAPHFPSHGISPTPYLPSERLELSSPNESAILLPSFFRHWILFIHGAATRPDASPSCSNLTPMPLFRYT